MRVWHRLAAAVAGGAWALAAAPAAAEEGAQALLARAFENLYADDYVQALDLTTSAPHSRPLVRSLQITRKQSVRPGKALMRFLEPFDVRRTAVLVLENEGASDDFFVYLPALGLTRRISGSQRADSFFGTDLSYEDMEPKHAQDYLVRYLPKDAGPEEDCRVVGIRPGPEFESTYERMVSCIEPERAVICWTVFHRKGEPVKRLETDLGEVHEIQGRHIPFLMTMTTLRTHSQTLMRTGSYELAAEIPDRLFSTRNLEAGDADRDRARAGAGSE